MKEEELEKGSMAVRSGLLIETDKTVYGRWDCVSSQKEHRERIGREE